MRKAVLVIASLAVIVSSVSAQGPAPRFGVGAFGGLNIPILQADQKSGSEFGVRGRVALLSFFVLEPNVTFVKWGKPDPVQGVDLGIDGSKVTSVGLDATLGFAPGTVGIKPFGLVGIGSYKVKNDATGFDQSNVGYSVGFGFGIGVASKIDIDFRGEAIVMPQTDGGSKKAAALTAGLGYSF